MTQCVVIVLLLDFEQSMDFILVQNSTECFDSQSDSKNQNDGKSDVERPHERLRTLDQWQQNENPENEKEKDIPTIECLKAERVFSASAIVEK